VLHWRHDLVTSGWQYWPLVSKLQLYCSLADLVLDQNRVPLSVRVKEGFCGKRPTAIFLYGLLELEELRDDSVTTRDWTVECFITQ
jgi:hypothetical protein